MNEQQWQQLSARLADIELPPQPDWWPLIGTLAAVTGLALFLGLWWWRRAPTARLAATPEAIRRLDQLQRDWQGGALETREAAYQLATLLRLGLGLRQLGPQPPPHLAEEQPQWQGTLKLLEQLRYRPASPARLTEQTFAQVRAWLEQGARPC